MTPFQRLPRKVKAWARALSQDLDISSQEVGSMGSDVSGPATGRVDKSFLTPAFYQLLVRGKVLCF